MTSCEGKKRFVTGYIPGHVGSSLCCDLLSLAASIVELSSKLID